MTEIILSGCNGKLGRAVANVAKDRDDVKIVAGVDISEQQLYYFPVFTSFSELPVSADVIIDASVAQTLKSLLEYAIGKNTPAVLAVTGYNEEQHRLINAAANHIPVFQSSNMSLGINLMCEIAKTCARVLGAEFDVEIVEAHHNQKLDAPSGTALMLAGAVSDGLSYEPEYVYERQSKRCKRAENEIGIHSIRGGTIVGEHEIIFAGRDETIKLTHSAASKEVFAVGALNAAVFISHATPGKTYSMADILEKE